MGTHHIGQPLASPEGPEEVPAAIEEIFSVYAEKFRETLRKHGLPENAVEFLSLESRIFVLGCELVAHVIAAVVIGIHGDLLLRWKVAAEARSRSPFRLRSLGVREVGIRFLGGLVLSIPTPYLARDLRGRRGRRRRRGRRGKGGSGVYPMLQALGIRWLSTPALLSTVARESARSSSYEEARENLLERGVRMATDTVRRFANRIGREALRVRDRLVQASREGVHLSLDLVGKRVVIGIDGGRVRTRRSGKRGRRRKSGRRGYKTPWREPRALVIYVIDEEGKKVKASLPFYGTTLGDADETFRLLIATLRLHGGAMASEMVITADGARWIWDRIDLLIRELGIPADRVTQVVDFYHAVEHLSKVAEACKSWSQARRKRWVRRVKKILRAGRVEAVVENIEALATGRRAKTITSLVGYFDDNKDRMRYKRFEARNVPIGSGAVESMVRRVVNLRLKSPGTFWEDEAADRMLHMRAQYKAGRWDEFIESVVSTEYPNVIIRVCSRSAA